MKSFQAAFSLGCDWVECDCRPSSDGIIVLAHDDSVTDINGAIYRIAEHNAETLHKLDLGSGEGVPTLGELVAWAVGRVGVMADVKCSGFEREIGAALQPLPLEKKIVPGAGEAGRRQFRGLYPDLPISLTVSVHGEAEMAGKWESVNSDAVTLEYPLVTPERVELMHSRGIKVYAWTVDDPGTMLKLAEMGVNGLISNRADVLGRMRDES
jgi:glycerophosphoryl diester phosphodiesterase